MITSSNSLLSDNQWTLSIYGFHQKTSGRLVITFTFCCFAFSVIAPDIAITRHNQPSILITNVSDFGLMFHSMRCLWICSSNSCCLFLISGVIIHCTACCFFSDMFADLQNKYISLYLIFANFQINFYFAQYWLLQSIACTMIDVQTNSIEAYFDRTPTENTIAYYKLDSINTTIDQKWNYNLTNAWSVVFGEYQGVDCARFPWTSTNSMLYNSSMSFSSKPKQTVALRFYITWTDTSYFQFLYAIWQTLWSWMLWAWYKHWWDPIWLALTCWTWSTEVVKKWNLTNWRHCLMNITDWNTSYQYIDNVLYQSYTNSLTWTQTWISLWLLLWESRVSRCLIGAISRVAVCNVAWSETERNDYFNKTKSKFYWKIGDYQEVEYIQSSWDWRSTWQRIDTLLSIKNWESLKVEIDLHYLNNTSLERDIFAYYVDSTNDYILWFKWWFFGILNSSTNWTLPTTRTPNTYSTNTRYKVIAEWTTKNSSRSPFLFSSNWTNDNSWDRDISAKLYYCKVRQNNVLVRDFIPCYRKVDWVIGLWDKVNKQFYTNSWIWTFIKGWNI